MPTLSDTVGRSSKTSALTGASRDVILLTSLLVAMATNVANSAPVKSESQASQYLQRYGYLENPPTVLSDAVPDTVLDLRSAIIKFQKFAGLSETGILDNATLTMMSKNRCGNLDLGHSSRKKRYVIPGNGWRFRYLTYVMRNYSEKLSPSVVGSVIKKAFQMWMNASTLTITETSDPSTADIHLQFSTWKHGDNFPFDGPGGVLAHAFYPDSGSLAGDGHFDDSEAWSDGVDSGTNLLQVATHEIGHTLGLGHSDNPSSVMKPFYGGYNPNFALGQDDIDGIRHLYGDSGASNGTTVVPATVTNPAQPGLCSNASIDAIALVNSTTYAFIGNTYVVLDSMPTGMTIRSGFPRPLSTDWPGLESVASIDAALFLNASLLSASNASQLYLFQGDRYWRYTNWPSQRPDAGFPQYIRDGFPGIPDNIDAAFVWVWGGKHHIYFIKGSQYFRYTRNLGVDPGYPRPLRLWSGLPINIRVDAAFRAADSRTYFFSGQYFYRFNDIRFKVENFQQPLSTARYWFGCAPQSRSRRSVAGG